MTTRKYRELMALHRSRLERAEASWCRILGSVAAIVTLAELALLR